MAVATTVARNSFNSGFMGTINLRVASTAGISPGTVLTVGGDFTSPSTIVMTAVHELPFLAWKCEVTGTPPGSNKLFIRTGSAVTG
jgi:hypothetical protein